MLYIFLVLVSVYGAPNTLRGMSLEENITVAGNMTVPPAITASYDCNEDPSCVNLTIGLGVGIGWPFALFFLGLLCGVHPWCPLHCDNVRKCCPAQKPEPVHGFAHSGHGHL